MLHLPARNVEVRDIGVGRNDPLLNLPQASLLTKRVPVTAKLLGKRNRGIDKRNRILRQGNRPRKSCPICGLEQTRLKRHVQAMHPGDNTSPSRSIVSSRYCTPVKCPIEDCARRCKKIDRHLIEHHHIEAMSPTLKGLLAKAKRMETSRKSRQYPETSESDGGRSEEESVEETDVEPMGSMESAKRMETSRKSRRYPETSDSDGGRSEEESVEERDVEPMGSMESEEESDAETQEDSVSEKESASMEESEQDDIPAAPPSKRRLILATTSDIKETQEESASVEDEDEESSDSSSGEDLAIMLPILKIGAQRVVTPKAEQLLGQFEMYLMSADCGMRPQALAESYKRQVRVAWGALSPKFSIDTLLEHRQVRDRFVNHIIRQQKPGTVKSYISALHLFMDFLITEKVVDDIQRVHAIKTSLNGWLKSGSRLCRERHFENLERAKETLLTGDLLTEFKTGSKANNAHQLLNYLREGRIKFLTNGEHLLVSAMLVGHMFLASAHRAGAIRSMTMQEYNAKEREGEYEVVSIRHHKTYYSGGAATVPLDASLKTMMDVYIDFVRRPQCMRKQHRQLQDKDSVFVNHSGNLFSSCAIFQLDSKEHGHQHHCHDHSQNSGNKN